MRELPGGSIVPVAQGVDTFIRPRAFQQAQGLPRLQVFSSNAPQIRGIQQGSGGNVQGFNQWAQLADALAPFNEALTKTAMAGGQMYAQGEYEKGRNDAIRAQILANQQRLQGGAAYAAENRRLEGVDPEAAKLMDRVNPFRQAGRDNQKARLAANEVKTYILQSYRDTPGAETWKPGDPRLAGIKVQATQQILDRFGLDQSSAGFQDYVNPEIAQAWDKVTTQQAEDHTKFLNATRGRMAQVEILQTISNARQQKQISWTEFTATGQPIQRTAAMGDPLFYRGIQVKTQEVLDGIHRESGLRGETTAVIEETLKLVLGVVGADLKDQMLKDPNSPEVAGLNEMVRVLSGVEVGPPESRAPAGAVFSDIFISARNRMESEGFEAQARGEKQRKDQFAQEAAAELMMAPSGTPEYQEAVERLVQRAQAMGIPLDDAMGIIKGLSDDVASIAERTADPTTVEELFAGWEVADPAGFDKAAAFNRLRSAVAGMPKEMQAKYIQRFGKLAASKDKEGQNGKGSVLNPILTKGIRAAIERAYPQDVTQATLRGVKDITGFMALGDANARTAAARMEEGARKHMLNRLAEAARSKGERLSAAEETAVATAAFNEYINTKDQGLREYLLPGGLGGGPGVPGGKVAQPMQNVRGGGQAPALPPGRKPNPVPVVSSSNLDSVAPETLKSGAVVLQKSDVLNEIERINLGQPPSAAVQRAARTAGMPVGQWLLRQADGYPGSITPSTRTELLRRSNQGQAAGQKVSQAGRAQSNPFGAAGMWLADIIMGTRPAMASQGGGGNEFPFSRGQFPAGLVGRGNGYTPIRNVIVTSAIDPESPGFDIAIEGGRRGAPFRWPFSFRVVDMEVNRRENNMERTGNRSDRFYGTNVTLRFRSPVDGREYDVISAHHDRLNPALRRGASFPPGTFIGTQGRTGSTTGTHTSLDVYVAGTRRPAPMAVRSHLRDGFARGSTFGSRGGYSMPARGALTGKATYYTGSGGSDGVLGGKTANGETFTGRQMTAAVQWSLKPKLMNKWLIVEDVDTGRRIRVWANDTGRMGGTERRPADRLIDLSPVAFTKLFGSTRRGVGNIRVWVDPNQRGKP